MAHGIMIQQTGPLSEGPAPVPLVTWSHWSPGPLSVLIVYSALKVSSSGDWPLAI